jgi:predicted AlkP superfamily pyrophosphatase or phosphodiesterase
MITVTGPNFFSISTGLYEENHGIIGNYFYDPNFQTYFDYFGGFTGVLSIEQASRDARWYKGEPIWQVKLVINSIT